MASINDLGKNPLQILKKKHKKKIKLTPKEETLSSKLLGIVESASFEKNFKDLKKIIPAKAIIEDDKTEDFYVAQVKGADGKQYLISLWNEEVSAGHTIHSYKDMREIAAVKKVSEFLSQIKNLF